MVPLQDSDNIVNAAPGITVGLDIHLDKHVAAALNIGRCYPSFTSSPDSKTCLASCVRDLMPSLRKTLCR